MFVSFEGIDRAGKTTQAARLAERLGDEALLLREPGGTEAGERLRELLKDPSLELDPRSELLLFCAARAELVERVIKPARAEGVHVICDRFADSTVAYQGAGRGLGAERVAAINEVALEGCHPDLSILLRIDPEGAADRGQQRLAAGIGDGSDRFESQGIGFMRRVADAYDEIAEREPERVLVIDAERAIDEVHSDVVAAFEARLADSASPSAPAASVGDQP
ncbi:MAG: dTMP kinase [Solirubrobacterales bacterium]